MNSIRHALVALMLAACAGTGIRAQVALTSLSIPESQLPAGCHLRPNRAPDNSVTQVGANRVTVVQPLASFPYPSNPWSGSDGRLLAETRKKIDPPPSAGVVDARPDDRAQVNAQWIEHVTAAYHALYDSTSGSPVEIFAIRFDDASRALASQSVTSLLRESPGNNRIVKGDVVVRLAGDATSGCFKAIDAYVRALK